MVRLLLCVLGAGALTLGCMDLFEVPVCTPRTFDTASTNVDTVTTSSGLQFIDGTAGSGAPLDWCMSIAVHYDGYLLDGTKFDSSRDIDRPLQFSPGVGSLIDGFEEGVIGMRFEGTRRLIIPPELGYGSEPVLDPLGNVIVPANSTIVFDVEVLGISP